MFHQLAPETNLHIFSFLSDREVASCTHVCESAHSAVSSVLKDRMKEFSIGRERFKALCLMNTEFAKFGIDIDSVRTRYLLFVNDIRDIALINEEVAKHILGNVRLQRASRLGKFFSSGICEHFPTLVPLLFSLENVMLPDSEEIIDMITQHTDLFDKLSTSRRFINLINKAEILIKLGLINEAIALSIFNDCDKFSKLDKNWYTFAVGSQYESVALKILVNPKYMDFLYDENLLILGKNHIEAAKIITENRTFTAKLNDNQLGILQDKVMEHIVSFTMTK